MVKITAYGQPIPKGSKKAFVNPKTGRAIIVDANAKTKPFALNVAWAVREVMTFTMAGAIGMRVCFNMQRPNSLPKRPTRCVKNPDGDKLIRTVWDAIKQGGGYYDDSQVVHCEMDKAYANGVGSTLSIPGVTIEMWEME
jgi:Holliday junction resolvase RusA-like endonuclease